ncbi:MAG: EamA family transporter [Desulfovibrio sp.]
MEYLLVLFSVSMTTMGQIFQKLGAGRITDSMSEGKSVLAAACNLYIFFGIVALGLGAISWLLVLSRMELSMAYPLISLGYVLVAFASRYIFHEKIPPTRWIGIAIIMVGIGLISMSR